MMKKLLALLSLAVVAVAAAAGSAPSFAQASGNVGYSQGGGSLRAKQNERNKRTLSKEELPPDGESMFIEASVLMNVRADEHVAVFGVQQECASVAECNQKMDATVGGFVGELKGMGISADDVFVDFASQNKIYSFQVEANIAREKLVGFELKKNVSVHYKDRALLDKLVIAASRWKIFDLIKVDYVVRDTAPIQNQLMEEAAKIIEQKATRYIKLLGIRFRGPGQVYAERPSVYFPTEMYDSYTAFESEDVDADDYARKYTVHRARKGRTFFFNALDANGFDRVVNPVVIEPVVQFTLYLKVKYETAQNK